MKASKMPVSSIFIPGPVTSVPGKYIPSRKVNIAVIDKVKMAFFSKAQISEE
jgi:hypothetical protein